MKTNGCVNKCLDLNYLSFAIFFNVSVMYKNCGINMSHVMRNSCIILYSC